jgi:1A family penicillin-binding protein
MEDHKPTAISPLLESLFWWRILRGILRWCKRCMLALVALALLAGVFLLYLKSRPLPAPSITSVSLLYSDQGTLLGPIDEGEQREPVRLNEIPRALILATLAAEDKTFFAHHGFSLRGIARALLANLKAGHVVQGASTITQQLARNLYLTHDRTWSRKWKEALYTVQLELHFDKKQILEMYLNKIYYGNGAYGVGRAARLYFHKKAEELTLAESAFLAGIPRGPRHYSPYEHFGRIKQRQEHILNLMVKDGLITQEEAEAARHQKLALHPPNPSQKALASYFRDYVVKTAVNRYGLEESLVRHGGLKIYTTLDPAMQKAAETAVRQTIGSKAGLEAALVSVDPQTGFIKAMVGGKDYRTSPYNRVFARRQPGSSFKPIVYLTALENGFTPLTRIMSQPTTFAYEGGVYRPGNFQNRYAGRPITMREAIAHSDNIYAVSTQFQVGIGKVLETARHLGIRSPLSPTPSLALGSYPVSPFEMVQAYATLAAGGVRHPLIGIKKIVDPYGNVLVEETPAPSRVTTAAHAFVLTKLMESVLEPGGTGTRARQLFQRPAAAKTGTTDWDGWLSGFTPDLTTTVWVGYDKGKALPHSDARLAQFIWGRYMNAATANQPLRIFPTPRGVTAAYIDTDTGYLATPECPHTRLEYFVRGTEPTETCPAHPIPRPAVEPQSMLDRFLRWLNSL